MDELCKVIIVEGRSDKKKIEYLIREPIEIICTNGTISEDRLYDLIDENQLDDREVIVFADADSDGEKLRKQFKRELPHAEYAYIDKTYRQVEDAPEHHLVQVLIGANIEIDPKYLTK